MSTIANRKNLYVRLKIDILILEKSVETDFLSTSAEGAYEPDKGWDPWEGKQ